MFKRVFKKDENGNDTIPMHLINGELTTDGDSWNNSAWEFDHGTDNKGNKIKIDKKEKYIT